MLHILLHLLLSTLFSIYIRARKIYHAFFDRLSAILNYHHRTPESKAATVEMRLRRITRVLTSFKSSPATLNLSRANQNTSP